MKHIRFRIMYGYLICQQMMGWITTNKQVYFGTCITSPASGGTLRRLAVIDRVKHCLLYTSGTEGKTGLIERYFSLMPEGDTTLQDIELSAFLFDDDSDNTYDRSVCLYNTLSEKS